MFLHRFTVFCFDFDGLLVDTEPLHYKAYCELGKIWNLSYEWDYDTYLRHAHSQSMGVLRVLEKQFPHLLGEKGKKFVEAKQAIYERLLKETPPKLMPGAEIFLNQLEKEKRFCCVVTNSCRAHVDIVKRSHPVLQRIPLWITREDYDKPKPAPDGYQAALACTQCEPDQALGFEDSLKGVQALKQAGIQAVWICPKQQVKESELLTPKVEHVESFSLLQ
jgi:HAD superfamily hydrolase (TIGR01509 family)